MKGIILSGGLGSRLYPLTLSISKQLLPIYDKPMIYYPLSILMEAGIREILIISTPRDLPNFQTLLGDGKSLGISISYKKQEEPKGIAESFILAEYFIQKEQVALILGDNIFYGDQLSPALKACSMLEEGAMIFGYHVKDPERYGVIEFNEKKQVIDIIEKPNPPPSPYAVTGLYFYDSEVISIAKSLKPSARGELEITDVNKIYLNKKKLQVFLFNKGFAWLDTGNFESLHQASNYVHSIQERQGVKIGCIEEIAYNKGWISKEELEVIAEKLSNSEYGRYLSSLYASESSLRDEAVSFVGCK